MWSVFQYLLLPFSLLYLAGINLREILYRASIFSISRPDAFVISIGNITLGGSGKTPLTIATAKILKEAGVNVAVVSRGYGGMYRGKFIVVDDKTSPIAAGDEAVMMFNALDRVPVLLGRRRSYPCEYAVETLKAQAIVLDDAFQHHAIERDLDIVIIDAARDLTREFLFPAGRLREPLSELKRADAVVIKTLPELDIEPTKKLVQRHAPDAKVFIAAILPTTLQEIFGDGRLNADDIKGKRVAGFSGIADNASFKATLEGLGAEVVFFHGFNDHHKYSHHELNELLHDALAKDAEIAVTTAKDAVKIKELERVKEAIRIFSLNIELAIDREGDFKNLVRI